MAVSCSIARAPAMGATWHSRLSSSSQPGFSTGVRELPAVDFAAIRQKGRRLRVDCVQIFLRGREVVLSEQRLAGARPKLSKLTPNTTVAIKSVEARPLNLPLLSPFQIATSTLDKVTNVAIRVELSDGSFGFGEAPVLPGVTAEDQPAALMATAVAADWLKRQPAASWQDLVQGLAQKLPGHRFASTRAGVEMALVDAVARSLGTSLAEFFGGLGNSVESDITIPICSAPVARTLAAQYKQMKFKTIKTKVGGTTVDDDISRLVAIRQGYPECKLLLDANGGYSVKEAESFLKKLNAVGLTPILLEQPVARNDWAGLRHVSVTAGSRYGVPVCADESCRSPGDAQRIADGQLAAAVNIKLAKVGVLGALKVVQVARKEGLKLMMGGMVESRIAMGFAAHFVAGMGGFSYVDLDTPFLLAEDPVTGGYTVEGPEYLLGGSAGHGGELAWF